MRFYGGTLVDWRQCRWTDFLRCAGYIEMLATEEAVIAATAASIPHAKNGKRILGEWQRHISSARRPPEVAQNAVEYAILAAQMGAVEHDH